MKIKNSKSTDKYEKLLEEFFTLAKKSTERLQFIKGLTFAKEPENPLYREEELAKLMKGDKTTLVRNIIELAEELQKVDL